MADAVRTKTFTTRSVFWVCLVELLFASSLSAANHGLFTYEVIGDCIQIAGYPADAVGEIEIPTAIDGKPVTTIKSDAFYGCTELTRITIPEHVLYIGSYAFSGCRSLTTIMIPEGIETIFRYAFSDCSALASVTIPPGVTSIGDGTFSRCRQLVDISIPESVTRIGSSAFYECTALQSLSIPARVASIGSYAFLGCRSLTSVTISEDIALPSEFTSIGRQAFSDCSRLTSITIPRRVKSIGAAAFRNCSGLVAAIFLGDAPTTFLPRAFDGTGPEFTVYHLRANEGFTSPIWRNYPASTIDGRLDYGVISIASISFTAAGLRLQLSPHDVHLGGLSLPLGSLGRRIGVEYSPDLSPGSWIELGNFYSVDGGFVFDDPDAVRSAQPSGFYRAFLRPALTR